MKKPFSGCTLEPRHEHGSDAWHEARRASIGASECGAVLGLSPYAGPWTVAASKLGILPPSEPTEATAYGQAREAGLRIEAVSLIRGAGVKIDRVEDPCGASWRSKTWLFLTASPDGWFARLGKKTLVEIKTAGDSTAHLWDYGRVPAHYTAQVQQQMAVLGCQEAVIVVELRRGVVELRWISFDPHWWAAAVERLIKFWASVQAKELPEPLPADEAAVKRACPSACAKTEDAPEMAGDLQELDRIKAEMKILAEKQTTIETKIKARIGTAQGITVGPWRVSWMEQTRAGFDQKKLEAERPEIYERYAVETKFRVLRVTKGAMNDVSVSVSVQKR